MSDLNNVLKTYKEIIEQIDIEGLKEKAESIPDMVVGKKELKQALSILENGFLKIANNVLSEQESKTAKADKS